MRKIFLDLLFLFLVQTSLFSAEAPALPQVDISKIDLKEERTEFRSTGASVDFFLTSLQTKILYHFEKSIEHFSLIFSSAKDEAVKKAEETITEAGKETVDLIKEKTRKVAEETIEKEIKKYSPLPEAQEKKKSESKIALRPVSPVKKQTAEKNRQIKKKSSNRAIEKKLSLPDLPEPPEAL